MLPPCSPGGSQVGTRVCHPESTRVRAPRVGGLSSQAAQITRRNVGGEVN